MNTEEILNNLTDDEARQIFTPKVDAYFGRPQIKRKMKQYALASGVAPSSDGHRGLILSVYIARQKNEAHVRNKLKTQNGKGIGFESITGALEVDNYLVDQETDRYEAEELQFEGFDDTDYQSFEETFDGLEDEGYQPEGILPIGLALKAGKGLLKKVAPKVIDKVKGLGNKILGKIAPKLAKQKQAEIASNESTIQAKNAELINKGYDPKKIMQMQNKLKKEITDISAKQNANLGNILVAEQQKKQIAILDEIGKVLDEYKKNETEKAKAQAMPQILLIFVFIIIAVIALVKFLK